MERNLEVMTVFTRENKFTLLFLKMKLWKHLCGQEFIEHIIELWQPAIIFVSSLQLSEELLTGKTYGWLILPFIHYNIYPQQTTATSMYPQSTLGTEQTTLTIRQHFYLQHQIHLCLCHRYLFNICRHIYKAATKNSITYYSLFQFFLKLVLSFWNCICLFKNN